MRRNIAICDDEKTIRDQLSLHLNQIQEESGDDYHLFYYSSAEELLDNMPADLDVILLDIAMGDMTGMECAKNLRAKGYDVNIIFIKLLTKCESVYYILQLKYVKQKLILLDIFRNLHF